MIACSSLAYPGAKKEAALSDIPAGSAKLQANSYNCDALDGQQRAKLQTGDCQASDQDSQDEGIANCEPGSATVSQPMSSNNVNCFSNNNSNSQDYLSQQQRAERALGNSRNVSSKFSAIHESLENRLQFNQFNGQGATADQEREEGERNSSNNNNNNNSKPIVIKAQAISEIDDDRSLINRLMVKLMLRSSKNATTLTSTTAKSRSLRARPTISMPIQSQTSKDRKSSLSTSLSVLNSNNNNNNRSLLSSSANLIQDSGASGSSDNCARISSTSATSGSSRSSSSSGAAAGQHQLQNLQNEHLNSSSLAYHSRPLPAANWPNQNQNQNQLQCQQSPKLLMINEHGYGTTTTTTSMNLGYQAADHYASSAIYPPSQLDSTQAGLVWNPLIVDNQQQQQHYQLPIATAQVLEGCYATNPNSAYGSLPMQQLQLQPLVPCSNGDDAYFESNYNTLLSSAYRNLNYNNQQSQATLNISNSSSPNSLTTQNTSSNNCNSNGYLLNGQQMVASQPFELSQAKQMYVAAAADNQQQQQGTVVTTTADLTANTITTLNQMANENGVATHV